MADDNGLNHTSENVNDKDAAKECLWIEANVINLNSFLYQLLISVVGL